MPHTKKAKSTLPKGARPLKSSTPKRPATSCPPPPCTSPSESDNTKRTKTHVSPKFAPPSSKSRPSTSKLRKDRAPKPTTSTKNLVSITSTVHKSKTLTSATTTKQKAPLYSTVASLHQAVQHPATLLKPPHHKPQLLPILAQHLSLLVQLQSPHLCLQVPLHLALLSRLKTPVLNLSTFILTSIIGKVRQKF